MGCGHIIDGVRGTCLRECAVCCPACPIPGVNLPPNWKSTLDAIRYSLLCAPSPEAHSHEMDLQAILRNGCQFSPEAAEHFK